MESRYATKSELADLGLPLGPSAAAICATALQCDSCYVPPAPDDETELETWLRYDAARLGNAGRIAGRRDWKDRPYDDAASSLDGLRERIIPSIISPAIGVPDHLLLPMLGVLSESERVFLTSKFVIAICSVCRHSDFAELETWTSIYTRFESVMSRSARSRVGLSAGDPLEAIRSRVEFRVRLRDVA